MVYNVRTRICRSNTITALVKDIHPCLVATGNYSRELQSLASGHISNGAPQGCVLSPLIVTQNNLLLSGNKTKELTVDFRTKRRQSYTLICTSGPEVEQGNSSRFLGVGITENQSWSSRISVWVKKTQQQLHLLRKLNNLLLQRRKLKS